MTDIPHPPDLIQIDWDQPEPDFGHYLKPLANRLIPDCLTEQDLAWAWPRSRKADLINKLVLRVETLLTETGIQQERNETEYWKKRYAYALQKIDYMKNDLGILGQQLEQMRLEVEKARKRPLVVSKTSSATIPVPQADWMEDWRRQRGFEKQAAVIEILGDTGIGYLSKLRKELAKRFGYKSDRAENLSNAIDDCVERKLIEIGGKAPTSGRGRRTNLVELTNLGKSAYIMLRNQTPFPSELLALSGHKTHQHLALNLRAKEYLARAGYEILEHEPYHYLIDGIRQAVPDIITQKDGEFHYFEVERDTHKSPRPEKWRNLNELSLGSLYIICESNRMMADIALEVSEAMSLEQTACTLYLTSIQQMKNDLDAGRLDFWRSKWEINLPDNTKNDGFAPDNQARPAFEDEPYPDDDDNYPDDDEIDALNGEQEVCDDPS